MEIELDGNTLRIHLTGDDRERLARGEDLEVPKEGGLVVITVAEKPSEELTPGVNPADPFGSVDGLQDERSFYEMFPQLRPDAQSNDPPAATQEIPRDEWWAEPVTTNPDPKPAREIIDPSPGIPVSCSRCGRDLTNPASKARGMGPVCAARAIIAGHDGPTESKLEQLQRLLDEARAGGEDTAGIQALINQLQEANIPEDPFLDWSDIANEAADWVEHVFREVFPRVMPGYEAREPQVQLAREVAIGMATGEHVAAEAGTGTGKSLAYLVSAIWWAKKHNKPVVVTTGTIALQEQLILKDVPFLQRVLADEMPFRAALVKGKGNYLCRLKAEEEYQKQGLIPDPDWPRLVEWMRETTDGDKSSIQGWVPPTDLWAKVNVDEGCLKRDCPHYNICHLYNAKRAAKEADILVCNHSLYMADVQVRMSSGDGASILPPHAVAVFDEAHHIEDVASESFGAEISQFKIPQLYKEMRKLGHPDLPLDDMDQVVQSANQLFANLAEVQPPIEKQALRRLDEWPAFKQHMQLLYAGVREVARKLADVDFNHSDEKTKKRAGALWDRLHELAGSLRDMTDEDPEWVDVVEVDRSRDRVRVTLRRSPITVAELLREFIWSTTWSAACLSATITSGGSFGYFRRQVGLDEGPKAVRELIVDSPFDYPNQALLYVPRGLPDPTNEAYGGAIQPIIADVLQKTRGRAFVLFTSYRQMQAAHKALATSLQAAGYTVWKQGDLQRSELVAEFKKDIHSILFATASFWEGVDVQGEALSCVIIDKIPFDSPGDPLLEARQKAIDASGGNSFMQFSVPRAVIKLKQGVGRLIRTRTDKGMVVILDNRLRTKPYGRVFLKSLPPMREIFYLDDVPAFLGEGVNSRD